MVMVLEQEMVYAIEAIGWERWPNEACGILIPTPIKSKSVYELPNRSKTPADAFELWGTDIMLQLETFTDDNTPDWDVSDLTIWHTHPSGGVGPSPADMTTKPEVFTHLVVTLMKGSPPVATWF